MKMLLLLSVGVHTVLSCLPTALADEKKAKEEEAPLCPMVTEARKEGLFQLVEVLDHKGNKNVGEPGEKVRIRFTTVNLTKRQLMVARDYLTPQFGSIDVRSDEPNDWPEAEKPWILPRDGSIMSGTLELPRGSMDWGHIRNWVSIAASHDTECGCCIRHRQYTVWLDLDLPDRDWKTIVLEFSQWTPTLLLGPEEPVNLESELQLTIQRRNSDQEGADHPATAPEQNRESDEKTQPESKPAPR